MTERDEQFQEFVSYRRTGMVRAATLLTAGDRHLAEDLVQSTLTKLYLGWSAFQRAENPEGYLRRALFNGLIDERRRLWRKREQSVAELPDQAIPHDDSEPSHLDALRKALGELPPRMRAAIVFRYFDDLSVAETADALNCSIGTVKSQTARALDRLRDTLQPATSFLSQGLD